MNTKTNNKYYIIIAVLVLLWLLTPVFVAMGVYVLDRQPWAYERLRSGIPLMGQIGDTFGVVNSLFTGLALLGAIYTIKNQSDEIRKNAIENQRQSENTNREKHESGFFRLVEILGGIRGEMNKGHEERNGFFKDQLRVIENKTKLCDGDYIKGYAQFTAYYQRYEQYIRCVQSILSHINTANSSDKDKLIEILWIFLSREEQALILMHQTYLMQSKNTYSDDFKNSGLFTKFDPGVAFTGDNYIKVKAIYDAYPIE